MSPLHSKRIDDRSQASPGNVKKGEQLVLGGGRLDRANIVKVLTTSPDLHPAGLTFLHLSFADTYLRVGRIPGTILDETEVRYFVVANTKGPCVSSWRHPCDVHRARRLGLGNAPRGTWLVPSPPRVARRNRGATGSVLSTYNDNNGHRRDLGV